MSTPTTAEGAAIERLVDFQVKMLSGTLTLDLSTGMKLASDYKLVGAKHAPQIQAAVAQRLGWKR